MAGRRFQWLGSLDLGAFAVAANWDDLTDAINPSTLTPGSADTIELASTAGVMNGSGTVADIWLTSGAATVLADLVTSTLTLSTGAGLILGGSLAVGSQLAGSSGTISLAGGTLTFGANVTGSTGGLVGNGVIGFGTADVLSFATLNAANALALATGDRITATTLTLSAGGAIAAGATLSALIGTIDGLSDAGTLIVQGSTAAIDEVMELGTLSGGGVVNIAADGIFELAGPSSNGIVFATNANALVNVRGALEGFASILQIDQPTAYTGTISGFGANDEIDLQGIHANSATLTNGTLDVFNGATLVDTLLLAGSYANQVFAVNPDYGDGSFIIDSGAAQFAYGISSFSDLVGEGSTIDNEVKNDVSAALANWSAYVAGWGTLSVAVYIENTSSSQIIAEAGPTAEIAMYEEFGGLQLPASTYLLRTGVNPTGAVAQIAVTIDAYQLGNLFLPTTGTPAANQYDAVSILTHELGHGLGIIGNATGSTMPSSPSTFDSWINFTTDSFYGPDAMAAMAGAPVPLATSIGTGSNWYHPAPSVKTPIPAART